MSLQIGLDKTAISLSALCAVHCLILPLVAVLIPTLRSFELFGEEFHRLLLWGMIPISLVALAMGCRKHKRYRIFVCGFVGTLVLGFAGYLGHEFLGEVGEKVLTINGGILVAFCHMANSQFCRKPVF